MCGGGWGISIRRAEFSFNAGFCLDSRGIGTESFLQCWLLSRFSRYRDTSFLSLPVSVPILAVSGHILSLFTGFCPDSRGIGTHPFFLCWFLSRFLGYRDTPFLSLQVFVPILRVSGHILSLFSGFCPDSQGIGTHPFFLYRFLSRFLQYRDTSFLSFPVFVPILRVSGHILSFCTGFCPDSQGIGTHPSSLYRFLSRFLGYRDTSFLSVPVSVPILAVSGYFLPLFNGFYPDSQGIGTHPSLYAGFCPDSYSIGCLIHQFFFQLSRQEPE